ncbi:MAG TPA: PE-PPE domain-containing protein [Mycobacterium sp.]|nr:PE-PPE domain-containing protein [Mycobacterium sp.]
MATAAAGVIALASTATASAAPVAPPLPPPIPQITEVIGGSGQPIPSPSYVAANNTLFVQPNLPGTTPQAVFTPEGLYPLTGIKSLPLDPSVSQGVTILNDTISPQLTAGTPTGIFGYSQSTIISSLEMQQLDPSGTPSDLPARFVLAADIMNPNGGIFERFDGLQFPSLGLSFSGATPTDDFPTVVYTSEYDGFADSPRYPINVLSDLNAVAGIVFVHPDYVDLSVNQVTPVADGGQAVLLPTQGPTETTFYMIPTENLPLLDPLRAIPVIGKPLADLIQPDLKVLVDLGYGDPDYGWSTGPANVPTPFGLFPSLSDMAKVPGLLLSGTEQGFQAFISDISNPAALSLSSPSTLLSLFSDPFAPSEAVTGAPMNLTGIVDSFTTAIAAAYASLLPTADIANAVLTSMPAYDVSLFLDNLGNPLDAVGLPIAADVGLLTLSAGVELLVIAEQATAIIQTF